MSAWSSSPEALPLKRYREPRTCTWRMPVTMANTMQMRQCEAHLLVRNPCQASIAGDPNMGLYRYSGTRQESMDIKGGMCQSVLPTSAPWANSPRCMPFCLPKAHDVSAISLCLLKQYEDTLGQPYRDCPRIDWSTFPRHRSGVEPFAYR